MSKRKPKQRQAKTSALKSILPGAPNWWQNTPLQAWLIFALACVLYANTLTFDYALDDAIVIYDNEFTTQGFSGIDEILSYDTFRGFFKVEGKDQLVAGGRYRPLTLVMFATEVGLFGQSPFVGHLVNILLYGLTCVLLYWVLLKIFSPTGNVKKADNMAVFVAFVTAIIFTAHPVHTEVVANIKGRDEILTLLGSLAALYFSLRAYFEQKQLLNLAAGGFFFLALLSKENAITFLAIIPLTYFFFTKAKWSQVVFQTVPFVLAAGIFLVIRGSILGWELGEPSRELMNNPFLKIVGNQYIDFTLTDKLATVFYTLGDYIRLLLFPHPLTHDYYPRHVDIMSFSDWQVILSTLIYIMMGIYALIRLPKKDPVSYGILYYLVTLSIVSNLFVNVGTNMNERFIFMPSAGFCLVISLLTYHLAARQSSDKKIRHFSQLKMVLSMTAIVLLLFSTKTVTRNFVWDNNFKLFLTDVETSTNSAKLRNSCGGELIAQSVKPENENRRIEMLTEAAGHLKEAIRIHPTYKNAYLLLGNAHNYLQKYEEAVQYYNHALRLDPNYEEARNNLSITYREGGKHFGEQKGDVPKAIQFLTKAYEMRPNDYETLRLLGVAYGVSGNNPKTIEMFTKAVEVAPENADALFNLGSAYFHGGMNELANEYINKAKQINPNIEQDRMQRK